MGILSHYRQGKMSRSYKHTPIGVWRLGFIALMSGSKASSQVSLQCMLSTSTSSATDLRLFGYTIGYGTTVVRNQANVFRQIAITAKTVYYLLIYTGTASVTDISFLGSAATTTIYAECALL